MSSFKVEIVEVGPLVDHDNADTLQITNVFAYPVIVKKGEFKEGNLAVYVPIDAVVPANDEWAWFHQGTQDIKHRRVKAKRLRGIFSMGLLCPLSICTFPLSKYVWIGDDVTEYTGITKYEPPSPKTYNGHQGQVGHEVPGFPRYTDIENIRRYPNVLEPGEPVVITEKIHGANFRCGWWPVDDVLKFHVGSHSAFRKSPEEGRRCFQCKGTGNITPILTFDISVNCDKCEGTGRLKDFHDTGASQNIWWRAVEKYKLKENLEAFPGMFIFGEVYGDVQDLKYGLGPGEIDLRVFDVYIAAENNYRDTTSVEIIAEFLELHLPPVLYKGPWDSTLVALAEGKSVLASGQIREGFVVRPAKERWDHKCGRVILKAVSETYLLRKGGTEGK